MAGSAYKIVGLLDKTHASVPTLETLRGLRPMVPGPFFNVLRAQDTILGGARRVLCTLTMRGQSDWNTADADPGSSGGQTAPEDDAFRTVGTHVGRLTPGSHLALLVLYFPSGGTQVFDAGTGGYVDTGNRGTLRVSVTWDLGANSSGPHDFDVELEGQQAAVSQDGDYVNGIKEAAIALIWPPELVDADEQAKFSEWAEISVDLELAGGARIVDAVLYERPIVHTQAHDTSTDQSAHAYTIGQIVPVVPQTKRPQTDKVDDATYDEQRFGTLKGLEVGAKQGARLGPRILSWSAWHPLKQFDSGNDYADTTDLSLQVTGTTTPVDLIDNSITSWGADNPGLFCASVNAQLHEYCDAGIILRGKKAVVPVRVSVRAEWNANGGAGTVGTVRVQSSAMEFVDVEFTSDTTLEVNEAIGWLEGQVVGDQIDVGNVQIFAWLDEATDGTIDVHDVDVDFGHWAR